MSNTLSIEPKATSPNARMFRRASEIAASVIGIGAGVIFADPVLNAAGRVWSDFVIPAYQTMIENGVLAWCF